MKVFIGCSSRDKIDRIYIEQARCLADYLAKNNYDLSTGGAVGVMQVVIDSFKKNKRDITVMVVDGYQEVLDKSLRLYHYKRVGDRKYALINNANLASHLGIPDSNILLKQNGDVVTFEDGNLVDNFARIKVDDVLIDGTSNDDIGDLVIKDREMLSENGIVLISATVDKKDKVVIERIFERKS